MSDYEKFYYSIAGSSKKWSRPEEEEALVRINNAIPQSGSMLEIGCGTASITPFLRSDINYIGIDVSDFAVQQAQTSVRPNTKVILLPAEKLPFPNQSFDFIMALHSLEHVSNPRKSLSEVLRVIKEHGSIYIRGPNFDWPLSTPNAIRHRGRLYHIGFRIKSVLLYITRLFGYYSFRMVKQNYTEATGKYEKPDDDLRHVMSADEMIGYFKRNGFHISYIDPVPSNISRIKKLVTYLPGLHYYGRGIDVMLSR
ncbi:MAG: methyltransferase domain-containing protein [bacterium]|nr:methyltransferase domain-containing protein [bacterium]